MSRDKYRLCFLQRGIASGSCPPFLKSIVNIEFLCQQLKQLPFEISKWYFQIEQFYIKTF